MHYSIALYVCVVDASLFIVLPHYITGKSPRLRNGKQDPPVSPAFSRLKVELQSLALFDKFKTFSRFRPTFFVIRGNAHNSFSFHICVLACFTSVNRHMRLFCQSC